MHLQLIQPVEALRSLVRFYWIMSHDAQDQGERSFRILANGTPGLVFQKTPTAFVDREQQRLPRMFLHGQNTAYYGELKVSGAFYNVGVSFEPMALPALFDLAAYELTDEMVDMQLLTHQAIAIQLSEAKTAAQQAAALDAFFLERIKGKAVAIHGLRHAIALIRQGHSLNEVQKQLNLSERTLERQFKQYVGLSPKRYARICRFQSALQAIRQPDFSTLTELAYRCNYFDQAHFIREFRAFAGTAPAAFLSKAKEQLPDFPEWEG